MVTLYGEVYGHDRTTASTYINDNVVVCILEDILSAARAYDRAVDAAVKNGLPMPPSVWLDPGGGQPGGVYTAPRAGAPPAVPSEGGER